MTAPLPSPVEHSPKATAPPSAALQAFLLKLFPFADATSRSLPFWRLLRLSLFQVSCGMTAVLLTGTLNRVMIVEMGMPGWLVALMVSAPLLAAPFRALIGFRSDTHRSVFGWRRLPYIWFGSLLQFGGLSIMPFALLILAGTGQAPKEVGYIASAFSFLMVGMGMHVVQTAGLALATDLATEANRPRVVAFHYVMLLVGMMLSAIVISLLLVNFTPFRLIQVLSIAALLCIVLNVGAMWGQETRARPGQPTVDAESVGGFRAAWRSFMADADAKRLLTAVALGSAGFGMQDVLLEPYGGQVLGLGVGATTLLTAIWAAGTLAGFLLAARSMARGGEPHRLSGYGASLGVLAFSLVILSAPMMSSDLFRVGVFAIGLGGGLFAVGTLTAAMALSKRGFAGLAIGAWGAVQATAAGLAVAIAGIVRDGVSALAQAGAFGPAATDASVGYLAIYAVELVLLLATVVAIGPLARFTHQDRTDQEESVKFGLAEFPT